jgi:hypothetical protein
MDHPKEGSKQFFFEKKNQKTFGIVGRIFYPPPPRQWREEADKTSALRGWRPLFLKRHPQL